MIYARVAKREVFVDSKNCVRVRIFDNVSTILIKFCWELCVAISIGLPSHLYRKQKLVKLIWMTQEWRLYDKIKASIKVGKN